ncbi:MAG: SMP-30/gluconolactonase/LRE family protein [Specibacter sp.]
MNDVRVLAEGLGMGKSARWHGGRFWYADWLKGHIHAMDPAGTDHQSIPVPSFPISFDWLPDGHLLIVSGSECKLLRLSPAGTLEDVADLGRHLASPWNEVVTAGPNAYVNCSGFTFPGPAAVAGIIALVTPDGASRVVADGLAYPNGMVDTDDGGTLVVANPTPGASRLLTSSSMVRWPTGVCGLPCRTVPRMGFAGVGAGSGTPMWGSATVSWWPKAARYWTQCPSSKAVSPVPWAGMTERPFT